MIATTIITSTSVNALDLRLTFILLMPFKAAVNAGRRRLIIISPNRSRNCHLPKPPRTFEQPMCHGKSAKTTRKPGECLETRREVSYKDRLLDGVIRNAAGGLFADGANFVCPSGRAVGLLFDVLSGAKQIAVGRNVG